MKKYLKYCRMAFLKTFVFKLEACGSETYFGSKVRIRPNAVSIGSFSFIGPECWLASQALIGNWVMLAGRVAFVGGDHRVDVLGIPAIEAGRGANERILIHDDVWIGYNATILHGVEIGEGAVVGAGAVVTKDVPPYAIVAGNPARILRSRFEESDIQAHRDALVEKRKAFL